MHKYKVGDKVLMHTLDHLKSIARLEHGTTSLYMPNGNCVIYEMRKFCEKVVTISRKLAIDGSYCIEESTKTWTEDMIKGLSNKFILGDIYE